MIDLYDSEILVIEKVLKKLERLPGSMREPVEVAKEIIGRFQDVNVPGIAPYGYRVRVIIEIDIDNIWQPTVEIIDRYGDPHSFDHDRMAFEVQHDILGIDEPGTIDEHGILRPVKHSFFIPGPGGNN